MANREGRYTWVADPTDVRKLERLVAEEDEARSRVDDWPPQGALKQHSGDPPRWEGEQPWSERFHLKRENTRCCRPAWPIGLVDHG